MPRTKGSKNKPKTVTADFATQIAEKQSAKEALTAEITSITANIDTLKADLKEKKTALKKAEKEMASLEAKKAKADAKAGRRSCFILVCALKPIPAYPLPMKYEKAEAANTQRNCGSTAGRIVKAWHGVRCFWHYGI